MPRSCAPDREDIQALERIASTKPMKPGLEERVEYEYARHGTLCLIANLEVATGRVVAPKLAKPFRWTYTGRPLAQ